MKKISVMALVVVLLFCGSVSSAQAYSSEYYKFSIDPPSGWTAGNATGVVVSFQGPPEGLGVSISVAVESLATAITVEQYAATAKSTLLTLDNYTSVSTSTRVVNGVDAYELVYTFTSGSIDIKMKQVLLVNAQEAYVITYGCLPTIYPQYLSAFESSVETFKIIEPTPSLSSSPSPTSTAHLSASPSPSPSPSPSVPELTPLAAIIAMAVATCLIVLATKKKPFRSISSGRRLY
jgi:hypothetical protein